MINVPTPHLNGQPLTVGAYTARHSHEGSDEWAVYNEAGAIVAFFYTRALRSAAELNAKAFVTMVGRERATEAEVESARAATQKSPSGGNGYVGHGYVSIAPLARKVLDIQGNGLWVQAWVRVVNDEAATAPSLGIDNTKKD